MIKVELPPGRYVAISAVTDNDDGTETGGYICIESSGYGLWMSTAAHERSSYNLFELNRRTTVYATIEVEEKAEWTITIKEAN